MGKRPRSSGCKSLRTSLGWMGLLLGLAVLLLGADTVIGAPTSAYQAQRVVQGWLHLDSKPLYASIGTNTLRAETHYDAQGQPAYHIVYLQPKGFVIVSADDQLEPIVGFVSDGKFDPSPDNPLGALVSNDMPGRLQVLHNAQRLNRMTAAAPDEDHQGKWDGLTQAADNPPARSFVGATAAPTSVTDMRVAPLVASRWSQAGEAGKLCYNYYTPNHWVCGCVATAMAQLMRFHQSPADGIGVHTFNISIGGTPSTGQTRGGDGQGGAYQWDLMVLDPDATITDAQCEAIGALCYDAGLAVSMMYGSGGSGAYFDDCVSAMVGTFGYSNAVEGYNNGSSIIAANLYGMINPNLDAGFPTLLAIRGPAGGHAIIADGYGYIVGTTTSTMYHHLNLGWAGYQDAWYNLPSVNSSPSFNVVSDCGYNIYLAGTGEILSGRVLDGAGKVLVGVTVVARINGGDTLTATTNDRGIYAFAKVPSNSTITVSVTGQALVYPPQTIIMGTSSKYGNTAGNRWGVNFRGKAETPPTATSSSAIVPAGAQSPITLVAGDDGRPEVPGSLSYIVASLPRQGTLADPNGGQIFTVPYTLLNGGNQVAYTPNTEYTGTDSFTFKAYDGGIAPTGGYSKVATVSIAVRYQIYSANMDQDPGWTLDLGWAYGTPIGGGSANHDPTAGKTGQNVIGYNLSGDYPSYIALPQYATTPAVDCRGFVHTKLSFYRWLGVNVGKYDKVAIQVSNNATTWTTLWSNSASTTPIRDTAWQRVEYDISKVADNKQTVYVRWGMGPTASSSTYPGWNIDDVTIWGDYYTPAVQFAKTASSASEAITSVDIPVVLSGPCAKTVTVQYAVSGGTAINGTDYSLSAGMLTFDPNVTTRNITISVTDDNTGEVNKTVQIVLSAPTNATLGTNKTHTYTIIDNDPMDNTAIGETKSIGTVTGTYLNTQTIDNVYESIREVIKSGTTYSQLEHRWTFNVRGGSAVTFSVEAYCSGNTDGDGFVFAYSTNGTTWKDMVTVTKTSDDNTPQTFAMPATTKGTVYVRVRDTNRVSGKTSLDTLYVDELFFHCE